MKEYHKIQSVFKRDAASNNKRFLLGQYSLPEFEYLANNLWVATEKIDGTNIRVHFDAVNKTVAFGGRTERAQLPMNLVERLHQLFTVDSFGTLPTLTLYGEGFGAGIQKGGGNYIKDGVDFILFDVKIEDWWLERHNVQDIANKMGIQLVPIVKEGTLDEMIQFVEAGFISTFGDFIAEGVVIKPKVELFSRSGERIISKLKWKDFH